MWNYIQEDTLLAISAAVGLVVFIILIYLFFRLRHKGALTTDKKPADKAEPVIETDESSFSPYTVADIRRALASGTSQEAMADLLKGTRVHWHGDLMHARPQGDDQVRITIEFGEVGMFPAVFCTVPLSRYPQIKEMYQGTPVKVQGTVSSVSDMHVSLENAVLSLGT